MARLGSVAPRSACRTVAEVPDQIQQSAGRKQRSGRIVNVTGFVDDWHGQIRRTPRL